jgi:hypothetical protein
LRVVPVPMVIVYNGSMYYTTLGGLLRVAMALGLRMAPVPMVAMCNGCPRWARP